MERLCEVLTEIAEIIVGSWLLLGCAGLARRAFRTEMLVPYSFKMQELSAERTGKISITIARR